MSHTIAALAADADRVCSAVAAARKAARAHAWSCAGTVAPNHGIDAADPLVIDVDATLVTSRSDKEQAAPTFKRGNGFHPLCAFADHGPEGTGEALAILLRAGNAGSNTAADHIAVSKVALGGVPGSTRPGRDARSWSAPTAPAAPRSTCPWLARRGVAYWIGYTLPAGMPDLYALIPEHAWQVAIDADGDVRQGAALVELTDLLTARGLLTGYPEAMRVIAGRERPHPGAQLRFDDVDGYRLTALATNATRGQLANLELRHRRRARCEDRICIAKDSGMLNLPLQGFDQNRIWIAIVQLAGDLLAWHAMLALHGHDARRWEPKRLRFHLFTIPATLARHARTMILHLKDSAPLPGPSSHRLPAAARPAPGAHLTRQATHSNDPGTTLASWNATPPRSDIPQHCHTQTPQWTPQTRPQRRTSPRSRPMQDAG